jgi:NAD(P)-dependent dehydrogenase (short-subunit alcohol dehydrogenase family)
VDLGLVGTRVLVTGGSAGIGRAAAEVLLDEGARVAIAARQPAEVARAIGAVPVACDLATAAGPGDAVHAAVTALGGLDVLVNNVGVATIARFEEVADDDWQHAWDVNVMSFVRAIRAALPELRRSSRAAVVNVASTAGKRPSTGMPHYSVTKAAVLSLSRLVADLYAAEGIRSTAIAPGPTATEAWLAGGGLADQTAAGSERTRDEVLQAVAAGRPLGRLAAPAEIGRAIAFLCSPAAAYVTGAAWSVDGGTVPVII